jgi:hypothetical protein
MIRYSDAKNETRFLIYNEGQSIWINCPKCKDMFNLSKEIDLNETMQTSS